MADLDDIDHLLLCYSDEPLLLHLTSDDDFTFPSSPPLLVVSQQSPESPVVIPDGSSSPSELGSFSVDYVSELEKFLMAEDDVQDADLQGTFFDDVFQASEGNEMSIPGKEMETDAKASLPESGHPDQKQASIPLPAISIAMEGVDEAGDDPIDKKKRRQMRNRDSAIKSRERKKMYIKELEMKSKYLEAECRRLDYALRCCAAENLVLHKSLHEKRTFDASTAKQEFATLLVESLLLDSLYWLVSIICLFLVPCLPNRKLGSINRMESSLDKRDMVLAKEEENDLSSEKGLYLQSFTFRRCRGMRTRIKSCSSALHSCLSKLLCMY